MIDWLRVNWPFAVIVVLAVAFAAPLRKIGGELSEMAGELAQVLWSAFRVMARILWSLFRIPARVAAPDANGVVPTHRAVAIIAVAAVFLFLVALPFALWVGQR